MRIKIEPSDSPKTVLHGDADGIFDSFDQQSPLGFSILVIAHPLVIRDRVEDGFRFLSNSIIEGRRRESELRQRITALEMRVWELEGHTPEETFKHATKMVEEYAEKAAKLNRPCN